MRFTNKLPSIVNVVASATAVLNLPLHVAYEVVKFKLAGITPAQMKNLKLRINGEVEQEYADASELQALNKYKGYADDATGYLTWWFVMPELNEIPDQRLTKLGTKDVQTLTIEFDIDSGATSPAVTASAIISNNAPLGIIKKVRRFTTSAPAGGLSHIDNVPTNGARISAIHFKKNDVKSIEVRANNQTLFEAEQVEAREYQKDYKRIPDTAYFHIDWTLEGDSAEALATSTFQDFRFKVDHTAAGAMPYLVEYLDVHGGGV